MTIIAPRLRYNRCMEIIYIDRLFILNLIIDYLMLIVTSRVCGIFIRRWRCALGALIGAVYAALSVLPELEILGSAPVKLCAGLIIALAAFAGEERLFRITVCFFGISALFGGAVWAISLQSGGSLYESPVISVSLPVLVISFGISYALISLLFRRSVKNAERKIYDVALSRAGQTVRLRALCDSGNSPHDPVTGSRVLIAASGLLSPLFPEDTEKAERGDPIELVSSPELTGVFRLISYSAVGTGSGLLPAFRPDSISIDGRGRDDILVALSPTATGGDGFNCIL